MANPTPDPNREQMDRYLESQGLLNYQTQGLSAQEIAQRYANANVKVNQKWFQNTYKASMPPAQYQNITQPQIPIQNQNQSMQGMQGWGQGLGYAGGWANQRRLGQGAPLTERDFRTGLSPDERDERAKAVEYKTDEKSGLVVKEIKPQFSTVWLEDPNQPQAQPAQFATIQQALMGEANWGDVSVAERRAMLKNPDFYKNGDITKFPTWMQQQVIADPDFQWDKLPKWQRWYFELSSSPAGMGAFQGGTLGLIGGPLGSVAGAVTGAVLGWGAGKSGYDPTKEAWEQTSGVSKAFGYLNWLAEQGEKAIGLGAQTIRAAVDPNKQAADIYRNRESLTNAWNAGALTFETLTPAFIDAMNKGKGELGWDDLLKVAPPFYVLARIGDIILRPEHYKGEELYLGAESPIQLDQSWIERIDQARKEIENGKPYREVMMDMQVGVWAQIGDMAGQALADPLNVMPNVMPKVGAKIADVQGNTVAAQALRQSGGLTEAARRYKTLVQTGEALKIDPQFQVDRMGWLSRQVAGITKSGEIRTGSLIPTETGLLSPETKASVNPSATGFASGAVAGGVVGSMIGGVPGAGIGAFIGGWIADKTGFIRSMTEQTPHSRAQAGANMFYENVSALLTLFDDPTDAAKYLRALANNDMETWRGLGTRFAESPEFYTVLPALKEFNTNLLDGVVQQWDLTSPNRDMLTRIADVMGEQTGRWLEDTAKRGTFEQDYQRLVKRVHESNSPQAQALKADIEAGRLTVETLRQTVDIFTGEGALPWHPGQWKAMVLDSLGTHFDEWVTKRLMLDKSPEAVNAFYRTTALLKQAQSILLLGGSPGYAITNGLSNMMHRAVSGIYGYLTPKQINSFLDRFGVTPARMDEGVGIGGMVEQAAGKSQVQTRAMTEAVKGTGPLATARSALAKISRGMPMSKLSSQFEVVEGRQGTAIAMKQWWNQSWRRGVGFSRMRPELVQTLQGMGVDPNRIYAAIEAGMNQGEIERALTGRFEGVQARSLVDDAARRTGMTASQAAEMLDKIGVLDTLDTYLKGQTTQDGVQAAFRRAERVAQDWMDMQTGEDLKAIAESVKQRVGLETPAAALDVVQKAHGAYTDTWMDHYYRFGDVMQDLTLLDDPAQRQKAIDYQYQVSDTEFRRVNARNAANYKGIFDAWGVSGDARTLRVLQSLGEIDAGMSNAYRQMREIRRGFFEKYRNDWDNPVKWDEWNANQSQIERLFRDAFQAKHEAEVTMGGALAEIYESLYGPAAGEAARLWWEDVTAFNDEIVKRERDFRGEMAQARAAGVPNELIAAQKQKYYSETKIGLIAELDRINGEGIARLERVIRRGPGTGDGGPLPTPDQPTPTVPEGGRAVGTEEIASPAARNDIDEVNALLAAAEQRQAAATRAAGERVASVWEVAEEYWGRGANYSRTILQDRFALVNALRKVEYGGIPDLRGLDDPRLTPEMVRQVLEARKAAKEAAGDAAAAESFQVTEKGKVRRWDATAINEDTSILRAVALHGGIDLKLAKDLTGEGRPRTAPGVFTRKGIGIDEMARLLADDGYPIDLNHPDDIGGVAQTTELLNRARAGNAVYPKGHDFSADIAKAEAAWAEAYESADTRFPPGSAFDGALFQQAAEAADLGTVYEMIGAFPDELLDTPLSAGADIPPTAAQLGGVQGVETWRDYLGRVADETAARVEQAALEESVAEGAARAELAMQDATAHGEAVTTRQLLKEQFETAFQLDEAQAAAWMEVADAAAGWFSKVTGGSADDFYSRYYGEVLRDVDGARKADGELSQAGANVKKGAVTFDGEGIKATIKAFEAADFSTLVHENGHVFRRVLKDVADTTGNPYVLRDLETIEAWAGVKDGAWNRAAEEKFARGFERYMAEGKAPTPALTRAFESFRTWMLEIYKTLTGNAIDVKLTDEVRRVFDRMLGAERRADFDPATEWIDTNGVIRQKEVMQFSIDQDARKREAQDFMKSDFMQKLKEQAAAARKRREEGGDVSTLFQEADQPFGAYDDAAKFLPMSEVMDEGWRQNVTPLLKAMEEGAVGQLREGGLLDGAVRSMDAEGQAMLRQYMRQVQNEMATTKLSTVRWGERQRDFALLNYSKRYGIDRVMDAAFPYQFYYSRSLFTWAARAMDFPALFSNYARMRMQQQRYERDIPERLRGRIKINAPWLPEWMGGSMYIDPISNLFFPAQVLRPFERMHQDKNYQMIEAERILQEWMEDGQYSESEIINAAQSQSGTVWERAFEEAQLRREAEISNPFDFFTTMFGPAWYLSTPLNLLGIETPFSKGDPNKVTGTPLGNTSRAIETVTKGTWAEPVGQMIGLLGKAEDWTREQFDLPTRGEYGEYYTKRQVANMVAEGLISADEAQMAMIEKQGAIWEQAAERVNLELAMRVPTMSALYGALHEGPAAGAQAFLPSLFGSGLLPSGELEYRGLKQEWNEAWKRADGGDTQAVRNFFEEHPEYQAYLAKGKDDEQLLRSFLIGQIWDQYMELGTTNQRQARAEMGALFQQAFLDKETRSYEMLDVETLTDWARMLGGMVPKTAPPAAGAASPQMANNLGGAGSQLNLFSPAVTAVTDEFFRQRTEMFPNWFEVQSGYYDLPKGAARTRYLLEHPELKEFWDWRQRWYGAYPQYKPVMDGTAFKRVDTTNWPPMLEDFVRTYAYTGKGLPQGARKALEQVWILEGMPLGNFDTWLTSQVVPAMRYGE